MKRLIIYTTYILSICVLLLSLPACGSSKTGNKKAQSGGSSEVQSTYNTGSDNTETTIDSSAKKQKSGKTSDSSSKAEVSSKNTTVFEVSEASSNNETGSVGNESGTDIGNENTDVSSINTDSKGKVGDNGVIYLPEAP